jgi:hypothetical protein
MPTKRWKMSKRREALFEYPTDVEKPTDVYAVLAKQMEIARPNELGALYMMRSKDRSQQEAMMLVQQAKTAVWTRWAIVVALVAIPANGLVTYLVSR